MVQYFFQVYVFFLCYVIIQVNYGFSQENAIAEMDIAHKRNCTTKYCTCKEIPDWNDVECHTEFFSQLLILHFRNSKYLPGRMFLGLSVYSIHVWDFYIDVAENVFEGILGLRRFEVERSSIKVVPDLRIVKDSIKYVRIESSHLTSLEGKELQNLAKVSLLSFKNNFIRFIEADAFQGLDSVEELYLSYNKLTSIPPKLLNPMTKLLRFHADHNNLLHVDNLFSVTRPKHIRLDFNNITNLSLTQNATSSVWKSHLLELDLSYNFIKETSLSLSTCNGNHDYVLRIYKLKLNRNELINLNDCLSCSRIYKLEITGNQIQILTETDFISVYITIEILLRENQIRRIYTDTFKPLNTSLKILDLSSNKIESVNGSVKYLSNLKELNLSHNAIQVNETISSVHECQLLKDEDICSFLREENPSTGISLENNNLEFLDAAQLLPNLSHLYLSNNRLKWLPGSIFDSQLKLKQVSLSGNPWICNCDALKFKKWIISNTHIIQDIDNIRCGINDKGEAKLNGSVLWTLPDLEFCPATENFLFIFPVCLGVLIFLILCFRGKMLYAKYQLRVKLFLYSHGFNTLKEDDINYDKVFDAFISFSHEDDEFVIKEMISEIEDRIPNIRLCLHYRHFTPGVLIHTNIIHAVKNSKTTLLILSRNYLNSEWCLVEFRIAYMQTLEDKLHKIFVVKVGDLPKEMDLTIEAFLKSTTYLTWAETHFWKKLLFVLPSRPSDKNLAIRGAGGDNDITINCSFSEL